MNKIYYLISSLVLVFVFAGCDGKGNSSLDSSTKIQVDSCPLEVPPLDELNITETIYEGDELVNGSADTNVTITNLSSGVKNVCVESGTAYILRPN